MIEGDLNSVQSVPKKTLMSSMMSLWFTKGFTVVQTQNTDETVDYLHMLVDKVNKESTEHDYVSTLKIKKKDKLTPENVNIIMLSQIPGISTVTAKAILEQYKTVFGLTHALRENPACMNEFTYGEKKRKLSKTIVENMRKFLT